MELIETVQQDSETPETSQYPKSINNLKTLISPSERVLAQRFSLDWNELSSAIEYSVSERKLIIEQLRLALTGFYVHLHRKKAMYGFDPVRALELLASRVEQLSSAEFHESIIQLIARVKDRHLIFTGKTPYGVSAILPFTIERCWEGEKPLYIVSKIDNGFIPKQLQLGAHVTHWNNIPIEQFVRLNANIFDGGNEAASFARSLEFLTHRPLNRFGPPIEQWVDLGFNSDGIHCEERFEWQGFDISKTLSVTSIGRNITGFGGDLQLCFLQHSKRLRFAPNSFCTDIYHNAVAEQNGIPVIEGRGSGADFDYGSVTTDDGVFAYIRLWSFRAEKVDDIAQAMIEVFPKLPQQGLILDMRGNFGGYIPAGERLLQLFTSHAIKPARFQFRITPETKLMLNATSMFSTWNQSFDEALASGELYTQGYPIEGTDEDANKLGHNYFGPVVVIVDALAFSTADIFTAGFIDNKIGKVICTDSNMAAAGGNNWVPWDIVRLFNPDFCLNCDFKSGLSSGKLSLEIFEIFNQNGVSLSEKAIIINSSDEYDGKVWKIQDGDLCHLIRHLPWISSLLYVYPHRSRIGLANMPPGVILSVTIRRSLRVGSNEGKILEDLGIKPDVHYRMTYRDVMEKNQDLFIRAGKELIHDTQHKLKK